MPDIEFGLSAYRRDRGDLVELPVVNMFVEEAASEQRQVVLQSRPGLAVTGTELGAGPVAGLYQADGVLGGDTFAVSGGGFYRGATLIGSIDGTGPVSFAGNEIGLCVTQGQTLYFYDGTTLAAVDFPDGASVVKVVDLAGRFVAIRKDTQKFYWTATLEGALVGGELVFDALDFASAENEPDRLLDMVVLADELVLLGTKSVEFWPKTGDSELPFRPTEGLVYTKGVIAAGCAVVYDNFVAWIGEEGLVYVSGQVPQVLSDDGIHERIANSATYRVFVFFFEGHEFLAVRLDNGTWLRDAKTGQWCEFKSYGLENWAAQCAAGGIFGSAVDGKTYTFGGGHLDLGGPLERRFRCGMAIEGGSFSGNNLRVRTNIGQTGYLVGDYGEPVIEMRTSRDGAQTWGDWRSAPLGAQGEYRTRVEFRALGMFDHPGFVGELRVSDPVPFRVSGVSINEPGGGRSR